MKNLTLKAYRAKEISFANKVENGTKIEFENKYSYNVNYARNNTCKGEINISAAAKDFPDKFFIKVVVEGIFTFEEGMKKEVIHVETFKELFPYARALVTTVSANAGIAPIVLPNINIEDQSIYRYDFGKNPFNPQNNSENN